MVLAMICMLGAVALGFLNKNFVEGVISDLKKTKEDVRLVTQDLGEAEDERDGLKESESQAKDVRNMASAAVSEAEQSLKIVQRKIDVQKDSLEGVNIEQREIDMMVKRVFPDGNIKSPDDLRMILTMLEDNLSSNQSRLQSLEGELSTHLQEKQLHLDKVGEEETYQLDRIKKISLGSLEATVIAVNNDWGFVMVNAGRSHGVEPDSRLLVKRGNTTRIARLRIVNLQENVCVCDVVKGSMTRGITIDAGDKVIFEKPFN